MIEFFFNSTIFRPKMRLFILIILLALTVNCEEEIGTQVDNSVLSHDPSLVALLNKIEALSDNEKGELFFMFDQAEDEKFQAMNNSQTQKP
jgi:hypothetical protein